METLKAVIFVLFLVFIVIPILLFLFWGVAFCVFKFWEFIFWVIDDGWHWFSWNYLGGKKKYLAQKPIWEVPEGVNGVEVRLGTNFCAPFYCCPVSVTQMPKGEIKNDPKINQ